MSRVYLGGEGEKEDGKGVGDFFSAGHLNQAGYQPDHPEHKQNQPKTYEIHLDLHKQTSLALSIEV